MANPFGEIDTNHKREHRKQVMNGTCPLPRGKVLPKQHDISYLGVCKDLSTAIIGIGILKSACKGQEDGKKQGIGHLFFHRYHPSKAVFLFYYTKHSFSLTRDKMPESISKDRTESVIWQKMWQGKYRNTRYSIGTKTSQVLVCWEMR